MTATFATSIFPKYSLPWRPFSRVAQSTPSSSWEAWV